MTQISNTTRNVSQSTAERSPGRLLKGDTPIRRWEALAPIFKQAEARYFKPEELEVFREHLPESMHPRIDAAQEVRKATGPVVKKLVQEIYAIYPFEKQHEHAMAKAVRDITYVVQYANSAMLGDDPQWFEDKLLLWLKTVLQSFDFPDRSASRLRSLIFKDQKLQEELDKRPKKARAVYHTYYRLDQMMAKAMSEEGYACIGPFLQQARDVLSEDYTA
jgi:hypothetical protein